MQVIFPLLLYIGILIYRVLKKLKVYSYITIHFDKLYNFKRQSRFMYIYFKYRIFNVFTEHLKFQKYESIRNAFSLFNYIYLINRFN